MADSPNGNENSSNDAERSRRAFSLYLRTGRRGNDLEPPAETKYNPWHDPDDGRFTHAGSGHHFGRGGGRAPDAGRVARGPSKLPMPEAPRPPRLGNRPPARVVRPLEVPASSAISRTHRAFLSRARDFPAKPGTQDVWRYTGRDGSLPKDKFKDQYISGHSNVFKAAAKEFDVPVELVASVAHVELGNDNASNGIAYALRSERGRNLPNIPLVGDLNRPRDETSFGLYNIQQRRAAEILGYGDINKMSETARRTLVPTTRDPVAATFMLAKHLSDLRNLDFPGEAGKDLTRDQLLVVATRYQVGPDLGSKNVRNNLKYGRDYLSGWSRVKVLINR